MLSGAPLRYRPLSGFSQANAPAPSRPVITAVKTIVDRCCFVNRSCGIEPPRPSWRSPEDFLPVTNVGVIRRPLIDPFCGRHDDVKRLRPILAPRARQARDGSHYGGCGPQKSDPGPNRGPRNSSWGTVYDSSTWRNLVAGLPSENAT